MIPKVIIHNGVSADGRIDGFTVDIGLYYELAMGFKEDATLVGSNTILSGGDEIPEETEEDLIAPKVDQKDKRPILVIPDSKGKVRIWHALRKWPYWRHFVASVSNSTPQEYLDYLNERHIDHIKTGDEKVDLQAALEKLNTKYGIKKVRVDSGGILNGLLLRSGLVDEVSVLIHPSFVGGTTPKSMFTAPDLKAGDDAIKLKLSHFEKLKNGIIWLRYKVIR